MQTNETSFLSRQNQSLILVLSRYSLKTEQSLWFSLNFEALVNSLIWEITTITSTKGISDICCIHVIIEVLQCSIISLYKIILVNRYHRYIILYNICKIGKFVLNLTHFTCSKCSCKCVNLNVNIKWMLESNIKININIM